ncbi:MFS transporter [Stenotrophomonas sp. 22385]|uniref:MFS transporter n=1 Tax=Stenotrophomonas sp. 22385 TaxID=3453915 RepID=UPI003F8563CB
MARTKGSYTTISSAPSSARTQRGREGASDSRLWPVYFAALLDQCALLIAIPVLPLAFLEIGYSATEAAWFTGIAVSAFACSQLISSPISGYLADHQPREKVLAGCGLIMAAGLIASCLASTALTVILGRVASGLGAGSRGIMATVVGQAAAPAARHAAFSRLTACTSAAYIVAPMLGGILSVLSWRLPFLAAGILALLSSGLCLFAIPRQITCGAVEAPHQTQNPRMGALLPIVLISFFCSFANISFPTTLTMINSLRFGWSAMDTGILFTALGLASLFFQLIIVPRLSRRIPLQHLLPISLGAGIIGLLIYAMAGSTATFYSGVPMMAALAIAPACVHALLSASARPEAQARAQSLVTTGAALAALAAPYPFSAVLAWQISRDPRLTDLPALPFLMAGFCLTLAIGVYAWKVRKITY